MLVNLVAYVVHKYGPIKGKKAFQKLFYFITELGVDTNLKYSLYHYGPYSSKLDSESKSFDAYGAINIDRHGFGFNICANDQTQEFANLISNDDDLSKKIDQILDLLPTQNPMQLELYSTTHYAANVIKKVYGKESIEDVIAEVVSIKKDKFSEIDISEAYTYLKSVKFIN